MHLLYLLYLLQKLINPIQVLHKMSDAHTKFKSFINQFIATKRPFTHISCARPAACYKIPDEHIKKFHELYDKAVVAESDLYFTECNDPEVSPIKIDIDIKFDYKRSGKHYYTQTHILKLIKYYLRELGQVLKLTDKFKVIVMEKNHATPSQDNTIFKDGFHIFFPDLVTEFITQYYLRDLMLPHVKKIFADLNPINTPKDIFDKAVIQHVNWALYGSKGKPENGQVYRISKIYELDPTKKNFEVSTLQLKDLQIKSLSHFLSIRGKKLNTYFVDSNIEVLVRQKQEVRNPLQPNTQDTTDLEIIKKLITILSKKRADNYHEWIQVGWCLHNINTCLYEDFITFSKQCPEKFDRQACQKVWDKARNGLTLASLYYWAKHDDPTAYEQILKDSISQQVQQFKKGHVDVARIVHSLYKHEFVFVHSLNRLKHGWYQFHDHRWHHQPDGVVLRRRITDNLRVIYEELNKKYMRLFYETTQETEKKIYEANIKDSLSLAGKLSTNDFVKKVMDECTYIFRDFDLINQLDKNPYLIGFNNGVYDLEKGIFRDGVPNDYISKSTNIDYIPFAHTNQSIRKEIMKFFREILPNSKVREYMLRVLASSLDYINKEEKFYIAIGEGRNGKSLLMHLHQDSLGDYTCALPVSLITQKRAESGKPTPEIVKMDLKRFCLIKEPDTSNISLNVGIIKELTGNDLISARNLHENDNEFRVSTKLLLMTNYLPDVYSDDAAVWDRIRVIEFPIHFCEQSEIRNSNDRLIDKNLKARLPGWKETYIAILIEFYKKYSEEGIPEPAEITAATKVYRERNNILLEFVNDKLITGTSHSKITVSQLYATYISWHNEWYSNKKVTPKKEFDGYLKTHFGSKYKNGEIKGYSFKNAASDQDTDPEVEADAREVDVLES